MFAHRRWAYVCAETIPSPSPSPSPFPHATSASVTTEAPTMRAAFLTTKLLSARLGREGYRLPPSPGLAEHLPAVLSFGDRLTLLELTFPSREAELQLGQTMCEVHAQWHERQSPFGGLADEALDLVAVQQQLARADGVVRAFVHRLLVRRDVHPLDPHLAVANAPVRLGERAPARAERFDL